MAANDPRANKIREQLQDYARVRSELATAQAHLAKTAIEWRKERQERQALERQRALLVMRNHMNHHREKLFCRLLTRWRSRLQPRRRRFDDLNEATHLLILEPGSVAAEELRSYRRKGVELFEAAPEDAISYLVQHRAVLGDTVSVAAFLCTQPALGRSQVRTHVARCVRPWVLQLGAYLLTPRPFHRAVLGLVVGRLISPLRGFRPDIALRELAQRVCIPRSAGEQDSIARLFSAALLDPTGSAQREGSLEQLLLVTKALLALDLSAHPDSDSLPGVLAAPVIGLHDFMGLCASDHKTIAMLTSATDRLIRAALQAPETLRAMYVLTCEKPLSAGMPGLDPECWGSSSNKVWLWGSMGSIVHSTLHAAPELDATVAVQQLASLDFNMLCADCGSCAEDAGPLEHAVMELQGFVCSDCATIHAKLAHQVKTITQGPWRTADVNKLTRGNPESRRLWLALYDPERDAVPDPTNPERMAQFLTCKYHDRRWCAADNSLSAAAAAASGVLLGTVGAVLECCHGAHSTKHVVGVNDAAARQVTLAVEQMWQPLLHWTLQLIRTITSAGSVALFVKVGNILQCVGSSSARGGLARGKQSIRAGIGLTGHAAREGRVIRVKDPLADDRFDGSADMTPGDAPGAMLVMPSLDADGQTTAVIRLCNKLGAPKGKAAEFLLSDVAAVRVLLVDNGTIFSAAAEQQALALAEASGNPAAIAKAVADAEAHKQAAVVDAAQTTDPALAEQADSSCSCEAFRDTCAHRPAEEQTDVPETVRDTSDHSQCITAEKLLKVRVATLEKVLSSSSGELQVSFEAELARNDVQKWSDVEHELRGEPKGADRVVDPRHVLRLRGEVSRLQRGNNVLQVQLLELQRKVHGHADFKNEQETVKFAELLQQAESTDLVEVESLRWITVLGADCEDRPVVVISAASVPAHVDRHKLLLHAITFFTPISSKEFVILYLNTRGSGIYQQNNYVYPLDVSWLLGELESAPELWLMHCVQIIVLHPNLKLKMAVTAATMFGSNREAHEFVYCDTVEEVYLAIGRRRLELPGYVYTSEMTDVYTGLGGGMEGGRMLMAASKQMRISAPAQLAEEMKSRKDLLQRNKVALAWLEKQLPKAVKERDFVEAAAVKEDIEALTREIADLQLDIDSLDQHNMGHVGRAHKIQPI